MKYYVYVLYEGDIPFYVGKGTGNRMYIHEQQSKNPKNTTLVPRRISRMRRDGVSVHYDVVMLSDDSRECLMEEQRLIALHGRVDIGTGSLLNLTAGGEGVVDYQFTDDHRQKLSTSLKAAYEAGRTGLHKARAVRETDEYREINRERRKMDEYRQSQRDATTRHYEGPQGEATREKLRIASTAKLVNGKRVLSEEARQKMRESALRTNAMRRQNPGY